MMLFALTISVQIFAQDLTLKQANKFFRKIAYNKAVPLYQRVLEIDSTNAVALHNIAECYRKMNDTKNAEKYFAKVVELPDAQSIEKYYYGMALIGNDKYTEGQRWIRFYKTTASAENQPDLVLTPKERYKYFLHDTACVYTLSNYSLINSDHSDFGAVYYQKGVLFSSNRYILDEMSNNHGWTGYDFYKVFRYDSLDDHKAVKFSNDVQTRLNNGPVSFDKKNGLLYVTCNNIEKNKAIRAADDQIKLQIYIYKYNEAKQEWMDEMPFENNNKEFNVAHPAISPDGSIMVFSSDMPGGYGGMDLYICKKRGDNWGVPMNLGLRVNTKENELFPFIGTDNLLIFASKGADSYGGLDLYYTYLNDVKPGLVEHFLAPINSRFDDFSMVLSDDLKSGMFSSNRTGGMGDDDVYSIKIQNNAKPLNFDLALFGNIKDKETNKPIDSVKVVFKNKKDINDSIYSNKNGAFKQMVAATLYDTLSCTISLEKLGYRKVVLNFNYYVQDTTAVNLNKYFDLKMVKYAFNLALTGDVRDKKTLEHLSGVSVTITDEKAITYKANTTKGIFNVATRKVKVDDSISYTIMLEKEGYLRDELKFKYVVKDTLVNLNKYFGLLLTPIEIVEAKDLVGKDLMKTFFINNIYFDFDKYNIRPDAAIELNKIVKIMNDYPKMIISLSSHTDCMGTYAYNMRLSDNRAKSTMAYLISKGINKNRLSCKGYGETRLVNECECEGKKVVPCTPAMHQLNRRTEFIVVTM